MYELFHLIIKITDKSILSENIIYNNCTFIVKENVVFEMPNNTIFKNCDFQIIRSHTTINNITFKTE